MENTNITTRINIENIAKNISNPLYFENFKDFGTATSELVSLFQLILYKINKMSISKRNLNKWEDYVDLYDDHFYTYKTFKDLVNSENDQNEGLTQEECKEQINKTIWQLPCGWYVQYV